MAKFSREHRRKLSEAAQRRGGTQRAEGVERDVEMLNVLGQTKTWEFAEHMGISEQVAKKRLRRLYDEGLAERFRQRGDVALTYVRIVRAGEKVQ